VRNDRLTLTRQVGKYKGVTNMQRKIIAVIGLTNTSSVNIYDIDGSDAVLAGINDHVPEWCHIKYEESLDDEDIVDATFKLGELELNLEDAMRV
jgi:hypothetical protein